MYSREFPNGNFLLFVVCIMGLFRLPRQARVCEAMKSPVGTLSDGTVLHQQDGGTKSRQVPIWEKSNLTLEEAAAYSGIGINKLRSLSDKEHCQFVLWVGSKRLIKRCKLDEYTERMYSL